MNTSDSIKELATALAKAQAILVTAKKDVINPHFNKKYADLASCWEAIKAALPQHGLSVVQTTTASEKDEVVVMTRLLHSSGEWIEGSLALPVSKTDAQGYGSALTYARRYGLCAITGVAPEEDDGNLAASAKPAKAKLEPAFAAPHTARDTALDEYNRMTPEEQQWAREQSMEIIALRDDGKDMYAWKQEQNYTSEEFLAIWSQLPSDVRTKFKKQRDASISKPLAEALGQA